MVAIKKSKKNPPAGFKNQLMSLSKYKTWTKVLKEWLFVAYYRTNKYKTCPGDPRRINHLIVIRNKHTNRQLEICNSCAERYLELFDGGKIENEVRRLITNTVLSMNQVSLDYLRTNYAISNYEYEGYQIVKGCRKDHNVLKFRSRINQRLLSLTDYNNKVSLDKIDCILVWIDKNPESNIDIKTLFDIRENLLTANDYNTGFLDSIITDQKIHTEFFNENDRIIALKRFEEYLNVWKPEYDRLSKYFKKSSSGTNLEKVVKEIVTRKIFNSSVYNLDLELEECQDEYSINKSHHAQSRVFVSENEPDVKREEEIHPTSYYVDKIYAKADKKNRANSEQKKKVVQDADNKTYGTSWDCYSTKEALALSDRINEYNSLPQEEKERRAIERRILDEEQKQERNHLDDRRYEEGSTPVLELISSDTLKKISTFILNHWEGISPDSSIDCIATELEDILDKYKTIEIWEMDDYSLYPEITDLYDLLSRLKFGHIKRILIALLCNRLNGLKVSIKNIFTTPMVCELVGIFSKEEMKIQYINEVKPLEDWYWRIGPKPDHNYDIHKEFRKNEIKNINLLNINYMISNTIPFDKFSDYINQWVVSAAKSDSLKDILSRIFVESICVTFDYHPDVSSFRELLRFIRIESLEELLRLLFREYPTEITTRLKELNKFIRTDCNIKYDTQKKNVFIERVENYQNINSFDDKTHSDNKNEDNCLESYRKQSIYLEENQRDSNKMNPEFETPIQDVIGSGTLHAVLKFIQNNLEEIRLNDSITACITIFNHLEIWDVYGTNFEKTDIYDVLSKVSLGEMKRILIKLLLVRSTQKETRYFLYTPIVHELTQILSSRKMKIQYIRNSKYVEEQGLVITGPED